MSKSKRCIITGRNKLNGMFYMLNNETDSLENIWNTGGGEKQVRKHCKRKIFESISEAQSYLRQLRADQNSWMYQWGIERISDSRIK